MATQASQLNAQDRERLAPVAQAISQRFGQNIKPNIKPVESITSQDLVPSSPLPLPTAQAPVEPAGMQGQLEAFNKQRTETAQADTTAMRDIITGAFEQYLGKGEEQIRLEGRAGIGDKAQAVTESRKRTRQYQDQLTQEQEALRRQQESIQTEAGLTSGQVNARVAEISRKSLSKQADIALLGLTAEREFENATLDLATAQSIVDRKIELKYEPLKLKIDFYKEFYNEAKDDLDKAEQNQLNSLIRQEERQYNEGRAKDEQANKILLNAMTNGAPTSLISQAQSAINRGDYDGATQILAGYQVDPLERQIKQAQLNNLRLTGQKTQLEIEDYSTTNDVLDGQFGGVIRTAAGLVGAERGKQSRIAIADAIKDNDYQTAYSLIANNVEESLTGENKTKFGAQRTDYLVLAGLETAIQEYADAGGDLGLLKGKADQISRKLLGVTGDSKLSSLAVQLEREFQAYRTAMTGAAFSPEESRDYEKVNPRTTASLDLNLATVSGARKQLENRITSTVNARVPGAQDLWSVSTGQTTDDYLNSLDSFLGGGDPIDTWLNQFGFSNSTSPMK